MSTLRWGILAPGRIANAFAEGLASSRHGKLAAVASRSSDKAKAFARQHGAERSYGSYSELLDDPEVDAVYIATPHVRHAEWTIKAADAGKHVLCEKPLAVNYAQAMAMVEAAETNGVTLMEAFMYRCHPQTTKVCELVRAGEIGQVKLIQATFSFATNPKQTDGRLLSNELAGGGILDVGGYPLSFARLIAGIANGESYADPIAFSAQGALHPETGVDTHAVADLKFESDILAQISCGVLLQQQNYARIYGTQGWIEILSPWIVSKQGGAWGFDVHRHGSGGDVERISGADKRFLYGIEADHFAHLVWGDKTEAPGISIEDSASMAKNLDTWRSQIGLEYEFEKITANIPHIAGRQLARSPHTTMKYGSIKGIDKPVSRFALGIDNQNSLSHLSIMCDDFFERGGNMFDTAYIYGGGVHEKRLGAWVRNRGIRDKIVIIAKGGHTPYCDPDSTRRQIDESLERQQTDYFDLYLLHRDNLDVPVAEFVDMFNEFVDAGKALAFGGSNWTIERVKEANAYAKAKGKQGFAVMSNNFSLARMVDPVWKGCLSVSDPDSRQFLEESGLANLAWSSQARGFFTERAGPDKTSDPELVRCWYSPDNFKRRERAIELAKAKRVSPINIAAAYVICQPFNSFSLIGPRVLSETRTSMPAMEINLTPAELAYLDLQSDTPE